MAISEWDISHQIINLFISVNFVTIVPVDVLANNSASQQLAQCPLKVKHDYFQISKVINDSVSHLATG